MMQDTFHPEQLSMRCTNEKWWYHQQKMVPLHVKNSGITSREVCTCRHNHAVTGKNAGISKKNVGIAATKIMVVQAPNLWYNQQQW